MAKKKIHSKNERAELKAWLKQTDKDFDEGFELFARYSHNRALAMQLARKRTLSKLVYELEKIVERPFIKESRVWPIGTVVKAGGRNQEHTETSNQVEETGKRLVVTDEKVNYDELPEELKNRYDENRETYKLMRAVHEKMKQSTKDQERAELRAQLVEMDDRIAANWEKLDEWANKTGEEEDPDEDTKAEGEKLPDIPDPNAIAKDLNACRSFISRNLKKAASLEGAKKEKLLVKIAERVAVLQKHNAELKDSTRDELEKLGLLEKTKDQGNQ